MEKVIEGIGKVVFKPSTKAKQVNITVKPFEDVVVSVPTNVKTALAEDAVLKNISWIRKEQKRMKKVEDTYTTFKVGQLFKVQHIEFKILKKGTAFMLVPVSGYPDKMHIVIPYKSKITEPKVQAYIRTTIEDEVKERAKRYLLEKVHYLATQNNITLPNVSVRKSLTRWGSCGTNNTLNLSYYLMFLPTYLIDYAICHELAHIKIKNHSRAYWLHLDSLIPGARKLDAEIKQYAIGVF